jgi:hypothetical protein
VKLHLCFEHISKIFDHVLFFRVRSTDIDPAYNQTRLPSLLIYRAGEMQEGLVRVDGLLRGQLSDQDVVKFLTAKGVLKSATMEVKQKQLARLKAERANVETDY